jgi:hypothetical protein
LKELGGLKVVKTKEDIMHLYNTGSSTIFDTTKWKDQLLLLMASCEIVKAVFKQQALKQSKLIEVKRERDREKQV